MSHETTATRDYVDESVRKSATDLAEHVGDLLAHVSAEDRARWGAAGRDGRDGTNGQNGRDGKSAYEIARANGFEGTVAEWLESLKGEVSFGALTQEQKASLRGDDGKDGTSAYVQSYEASSAPGGTSVLVLHDSRGTTRIEIHNGRDGADGRDGKDGRAGNDGLDGTVSINSMTADDRAALLASVQDYISEDPAFVGEKGEPGERGSRFHASYGTFSGDDTTPGNISGAGTFVDDAQPGDMLLIPSTRKMYECIAAAGDVYGGSTQPVSLWAYKMAVVSEPFYKSEFIVHSGTLEFPLPPIIDGRLPEYVLYVMASGPVTVDPATSFRRLTAAGYTVYSNNDNLMDTLSAGTIAAFTMSPMGESNNMAITRELFGPAIARPAVQ